MKMQFLVDVRSKYEFTFDDYTKALKGFFSGFEKMKPKQGQIVVNIFLKNHCRKWHMVMMDNFITNIKSLRCLEAKCKKCYTYNMQQYDKFAQNIN
jgi:hypothetical protein